MEAFNQLLRIFSAAFLLLLSNSNAIAQQATLPDNQLIMAAQIRARAEYRDGNFQPISHSSKPAALISQRTRLSIHYRYKQQLSIQLSPQQVSIWGQDGLTQNAGTNNGIGFYEAWAQWHFNKTTSLRIGRQVISLDDERILGELDWAQGARVHDAIGMHHSTPKWESKFFAAFNQNYKELYGNNQGNSTGTLYSPKNASPYKWMQTAWARFNLKPSQQLSLLVNVLGFQNAAHAADSAHTYFTATMGMHYGGINGKWKQHASAYYQAGKNAQGLSTNAYLLSMGMGYQINKHWNSYIAADWLSGNDVKAAPGKRNHSFLPLLGTNHRFYGSMDYYYAGNAHKNAGLADIYVKASYTTGNRWQANMSAHQFSSSNNIINGSNKLSHNLGQEADIDFTYTLHKFVKLTGGYSIYFTTATLQYLKSVTRASGSQHWAWLSFNIQPQLLNIKQE